MRNLITSILMIVVMTATLGFGYPLAVWAVSQALFPHQANGSLISKNGELAGSELIGQKFTSPGYLHGRLSAAGSGYDAAASSGSNLGPTSAKLVDRVTTDAQALNLENPTAKVPADLVTTSASGLDPHISPAAAEFQVARIAAERNMSEADIRSAIAKFTEVRWQGFIGEPRVNVLKVNLELDRISDTK